MLRFIACLDFRNKIKRSRENRPGQKTMWEKAWRSDTALWDGEAAGKSV